MKREVSLFLGAVFFFGGSSLTFETAHSSCSPRHCEISVERYRSTAAENRGWDFWVKVEDTCHYASEDDGFLGLLFVLKTLEGSVPEAVREGTNRALKGGDCSSLSGMKVVFNLSHFSTIQDAVKYMKSVEPDSEKGRSFEWVILRRKLEEDLNSNSDHRISAKTWCELNQLVRIDKVLSRGRLGFAETYVAISSGKVSCELNEVPEDQDNYIFPSVNTYYGYDSKISTLVRRLTDYENSAKCSCDSYTFTGGFPEVK